MLSAKCFHGEEKSALIKRLQHPFHSSQPEQAGAAHRSTAYENKTSSRTPTPHRVSEGINKTAAAQPWKPNRTGRSHLVTLISQTHFLNGAAWESARLVIGLRQPRGPRGKHWRRGATAKSGRARWIRWRFLLRENWVLKWINKRKGGIGAV